MLDQSERRPAEWLGGRAELIVGEPGELSHQGFSVPPQVAEEQFTGVGYVDGRAVERGGNLFRRMLHRANVAPEPSLTHGIDMIIVWLV
ncbi:hypothetical protein GCM10010277_74440 [Streptomyces longisporoflavus]|nr:hypothetical protein GCM10010277_74440 [Streptomyces longisporoflavus]